MTGQIASRSQPWAWRALGLDPADGAGGRAHHHCFRLDPPPRNLTPFSMPPSVTPVAAKNTSPEARSLSRVLAVDVGDAERCARARVVVLQRHQPALHLAADAAQRRRRQHAFGRAAGADIDVDAGFLRCHRVDDAGDVAVADQPDRGAGRPHLGDQLGVARPVEDAGGDLRPARRPWPWRDSLMLSAGDASRSTVPSG